MEHIDYKKRMEELGIPMIGEVKEGLFEGGDFMFMNEHWVAVGMADRTNEAGLGEIKKILIYGSKLMLFETDRSVNPDLADDQIILSCYYEKITKTIISFCLRKIKMWNIFTGKRYRFGGSGIF